MASNSLYGNQYSGVEIVQFQWFIFQSSLTAPATPTGGSWNFQTGVGTPPSGWSDAPPASPSNEVWVSIALVSSLSPSTFTWSAPGLWYQQGAAGQVAVGTTTTLSPGASATVNNSGTSYNAVLNFGIPQGIQGPTGSTGPTGPTGPTGSAATIAVGTTTTLSSGSSATVNNSGSSSAATFNFGIPQGIPGTAATIAVGTTTTTNPGTSATVTNSGTSGAAVFNFGIPKGAGVSSGGTTGQALIKNSNADYDTTWTTITGTLVYQGSWNASTNTPTLTSSVGTNGYYYIVSVAGTTNLNGITDWQPNDWAIFNGSFWEKIDNTDLVTSVNSYTGAVVLTNTDVGAPTYAGVGATGTWPISVTGNSATVTNGVYTSGSYSNPTWITGLAGSKVTAIPNSSLTNSTISGISLGSNLANLTAGTNVTFSSGSTYNGSTAITINASSTMVYPSAGIPNSTGSAWGTSYSTTGSGTVLALATSPTFVTPVLGTPTSGNFSTGTFTWPTFNQNTTGTASNVTGTVAVANGGTGLTTTPANGALDIGNGTGFTRTTLTAGTGVTITNASGSITIAASGTGVTSVTGTSPVVSSGGTTPAISLATAYGDTLNPYASKTANYVLAAPNGTAGVPTFRAIVAADIPTLNQNTTGTASNVTGIVAVANGGTGVTSSSGANSVVLRDSNGNITTNCLFEGYTNQVASGTTVVLTASSVQNWIITGSGGQTIKLPDATTLPAGATFTFNNNQSSGTLVIQNNSSTTVATVQSGSYITVVLLINSSAAGSWDFHNSTPSNASWSTNTLSWVGSYTGGTWNGNAVGLLYGGTNANLTAVNGGAVYSTGSALAITAAGTSGQVLTSNGASAPTWTTLSIGGGTF